MIEKVLAITYVEMTKSYWRNCGVATRVASSLAALRDHGRSTTVNLWGTPSRPPTPPGPGYPILHEIPIKGLM